MWHQRTIEQFIVDRRIDAEKAKGIMERMALHANAQGHFSNGFLREILGHRDVARSFVGEWAIDPLGKKLQERQAAAQMQ